MMVRTGGGVGLAWFGHGGAARLTLCGVHRRQGGGTARRRQHHRDEAARAGAVVVAVSNNFIGTPFGGYKQSGVGREECLEELISFTQEKNININLAGAAKS
ncbi:MAG TPA: aldehyde dehydrogenase family protein [Xanthobacteraceae bacterium]